MLYISDLIFWNIFQSLLFYYCANSRTISSAVAIEMIYCPSCCYRKFMHFHLDRKKKYQRVLNIRSASSSLLTNTTLESILGQMHVFNSKGSGVFFCASVPSWWKTTLSDLSINRAQSPVCKVTQHVKPQWWRWKDEYPQKAHRRNETEAFVCFVFVQEAFFVKKVFLVLDFKIDTRFIFT